MKTLLGKAIAALLALGLMLGPGPAWAQSYYFWFQAVTEDGEPFTEEGAVRCSVYGRDATTGSFTVHTTAALTAAYTLPLASSANGLIHWYSSSADPVNLKCFTQYGDYSYKNNFARTRHRVAIDTASAYKIFRFPYVTNASPTSTGLILPQGAVVTGMAVERISIGDGAHLNVGFAGNHAAAVRNALINAIAIDQRGFLKLHSQGGSATAGARHFGAAVRHVTAGQSGQTYDLFMPYTVHVSSGLEITYDTSNRAGLGGHAYILFELLHVGANRQPYR